MEAIVVAAIGALGAVVAASINAWAHVSARREQEQPKAADDGTDEGAEPPPRRRRLLGAVVALWRLFGRLPPLPRRKQPWVAGLVGFLFSGFGVMLYFRKGVDILVGLAALVPLTLVSTDDTAGTDWAYWPFATLTAIYCILRAESSNRRLERELPEPA